jgi:hypothetical protein
VGRGGEDAKCEEQRVAEHWLNVRVWRRESPSILLSYFVAIVKAILSVLLFYFLGIQSGLCQVSSVDNDNGLLGYHLGDLRSQWEGNLESLKAPGNSRALFLVRDANQFLYERRPVHSMVVGFWYGRLISIEAELDCGQSAPSEVYAAVLGALQNKYGMWTSQEDAPNGGESTSWIGDKATLIFARGKSKTSGDSAVSVMVVATNFP